MSKRENPQFILLVEGSEDRHFIQHFSTYGGMKRGQFEVIEKQGYENLIDTLDVEVEASELQRLGLVVDADLDIATRWHSLRNKIQQCGYVNVPTQPQVGGAILTAPNRVPLGIWVMPNNELPGMLEDFVTYLVPTEDLLWSRAKASVDSIPVSERRFAAHHQTKAEIHTWLAWQEWPGTPLGLAITRRYLEANTIVAQQFLVWLKQLFGD